MTTIYQKIRTKGGRLTKIRKAIIDILLKQNCFLSNAEIVIRLNRLKLHPDRSTIFRELGYLVKNQIIIKTVISGINYFEITQDHHHHLICLDCESIVRVDMGNHLEKQEKLIARQNNFKITGHSLEFYGRCRNCKKIS